MAQYLTPGVYVNEIDLSNYIPAVSTSVGAFVGEFDWGPVYSVMTLTNVNGLDKFFGRPSDTNYEDWFTAWNFLNYTTTLKLVRAVNRATSKNATASGAGLLINSFEEWDDSYSDGSGAVGAWAAKYPSAKGNHLYVSLCGPGTAFNGSMEATVTANSGNAILSFSANSKADAGRPLQIGDMLRIGANTDWMSVIDISATGTTVTVNNANLVINAVSQNVVARWEFAHRFGVAPGTTTLAEKYGGSNDEVHIAVVGRYDNFTRGTKAFARTANVVLELWEGLSVAAGSPNRGKNQYYRDILARKSKYIYWMSHPEGATNWGNTANGRDFTVLSKPYSVQLGGGTQAAPSDGDIIEAYNLFRDKEQQEVSFLLTGSHSPVVKKYVLENIAETRGDCVAFIGPEKTDVVMRSNPSVVRDSLITKRGYYPSSSYGFFIDNWKHQYDTWSDVYRWVPLDGDVAGLAARTDDEKDAWWSFAGFNRGQIKNVARLAWKSDEGLREELYPKGINSIVRFTNEGTILYGDRTMQIKPSAFDRINVRRLFITIEKAISIAAKYLLFEFNDAFTRAQFVAMIEPYLRDIQGKRGIYDFRVVCDESNNPGEVIDRNEFVGDIYIKPAKSINFLQLNFVAVRTDVVFEEIAGKFGG